MELILSLISSPHPAYSPGFVDPSKGSVYSRYHCHFIITRVFHASVSRWFFIGVWVTASLLMPPGLFTVFWPISEMLYFGWSALVLLFPSPPVPESILWWLHRAQQLQRISPSLTCSIDSFQFSSKVKVFISFFAFFQFYPVVSRNDKVHYSADSFFCCWLSIGVVVWLR